MVMSGWPVHITTLFPGQAWTRGWPVLRAHTFAFNWRQPFLNASAGGGRMTVEIISWSISTKVWDRAGIEYATPGTAVRHATLPTALRGPVYLSVNRFGSKSAPTLCRAWYGSKRFANAVSTCKTSPLVWKRLNSTCIVLSAFIRTVCDCLDKTCVESMHTDLVGLEAAYTLSSLDNKDIGETT